MVWIHGGGYRGGDGGGFYISDSFAKEAIILVTINYRLGPLGFMAHPLLSAESPKKYPVITELLIKLCSSGFKLTFINLVEIPIM